MSKFLKILIFCFFCNNLTSQNCDLILKSAKPSIALKNVEYTQQQLENQKMSITNCKRCLQITNDPTEISKYHYKIANTSYHYYRNDEDILFHLRESFYSDPTNFCQQYLDITSDFEDPDVVEIFQPHFIDLIVHSFVDSVRVVCQNSKKDEVTGIDKADSTFAISVDNNVKEIISEIRTNDQKYRGHEIIDRTEQRILDLKNRDLVEGLFEEIGFPTAAKVGLEGQNTIWLVLHHSVDCDWNEKWIIRIADNFIETHQKFGFIENAMNSTIDRFYFSEDRNTRNGLCMQKDEINSKLFIAFLKENYSKEVLEYLGIDD
jgi:hypothetical protein